MQERHIQNDHRIPAEYLAATTLPKPQSETSRAKSCLLVTSAFIGLLFVACACASMFYIHHTLNRVEHVAHTLTSAEPDAKEVKTIVSNLRMIGDHVFFFGATDGLIPAFLGTLLNSDFASMGSKVSSMATSLQSAFMQSPQDRLCKQFVRCPRSQTTLYCPDNTTRYCYWSGQQVNCAIDDTCVASSLISGSSIVHAVASKLQGWKKVRYSSSQPAAFSSGLFRLDLMLDWVINQMNVADWRSASTVCSAFTSQVNGIDWRVSYYKLDGSPANYDANADVRSVIGYFDQVCQPLKQLSSKSKVIAVSAGSHTGNAKK